jgi:hypothetical protein
MSMNICLRLNGQYLEFPWQTSTHETYRIMFENSHHRNPAGQPLRRDQWESSSPARKWGKLCHIMQNTHFYETISKRQAKEHFRYREGWEKRSWRAKRKDLWTYLCWLRDTPGLEITYG